jgi:hypothetical protein
MCRARRNFLAEELASTEEAQYQKDQECQQRDKRRIFSASPEF